MDEQEKKRSLEETNQNIDNVVEENKKEEVKSSNDNSRKGKREVVVQYRKPSFFTSLLLILMGACIATAVLGCIYIFKLEDKTDFEVQNPQNHEESVSEENENDIKVTDLDLDINGEFVQSLYKKIPSWDKIIGNSVYSNDKITQVKIPYYNKMLYVLLNMRENKEFETKPVEGILDRLTKVYGAMSIITEVQVYLIENIEKNYKDTFGADKNIIKESINHIAYIFEYDEQDDCFYGHLYAGGGGQPYLYDRKIDSVEKSEDGKEIIIYDYFIRIQTDSKEVYSYDTDKGNPIGKEEDPFDNNTSKIKEGIIDKYIGNGLVKFKNTFKLDEKGNYYWYSTEPITEQN